VVKEVKEEENTAPAENNTTETKQPTEENSIEAEQPAKAEEVKEEESIDIEKLNKELEKTNKSLGGWNRLIDNSDFLRIFDFAKQKSIVSSKRDKISGIEYRELMINFLVEDKKNEEKEAERKVNEILYGKIIKK